LCDWFNRKYLSWQLNQKGEDYEEMKEQIENLEPLLKSKSKLLEMIEWGNPTETSLETTIVVNYEQGKVAQNLFYAKLYPEKSKYYMIEAKTEMSDLLTQCKVICDREGWDFDDLVKMGVDRMIERIDRRMKLRE